MKRIYASLLILTITVVIFADVRILYGHAKDRITQQLLDEVSISVYKKRELIAISKSQANLHLSGGDAGYYYAFEVPMDSATYTFRYEKEGYETVEKTIFVKRFKKIENGRGLPVVYLMPKTSDKKLEGVTVKATKIKFYHKGDTLVFNADLFNLPQGSMLDNLIKSMPGAELSDEGEITINGRKVDALLLNGEDFFKGKRGIVLENLPAYMVKNLKAYERQDKISQKFGRKDEEYVLDVILKKEYSIGWISNAEVGAGSENRYLARLFGLRFTTASRIGLYANFNNLNDKRKPGENSQWTPDKMPFGLLSQKSGGIDYLIKPKFSSNKFSGNADLSYTDGDYKSEETTETYMTLGSQYTRSRYFLRNKNFSFSTRNNWKMFQTPDETGLTISPNFSYSRYDNRNNSLSATFNDNPYDYANGEALFDSIYQMQGSNLRRMMLNKYNRNVKSNGHTLSTSLSNTYSTMIGGIFYAFGADFYYTDSKSNKFDLYNLSYPNQTTQNSQYLNRYIHDKPNRGYGYSARTKAIMRLLGGRLEAFVSVGQRYNKQTNSRYNLETLTGWEEGSQHEFGELPSEREFLYNALDNDNSFDLFLTDTYQDFIPEYIYEINKEKSSTLIYVVPEISNHHYRLDYTRGNVYSGVTKHDALLLKPQFRITHSWKESKKAEFQYNMTQSAPTMVEMVEIDNTSDPLNTYSGNSRLKKSTNHTMTLHYENVNAKKQRNFNIDGLYSTTVNAFAYAYTTDPITGHRNYIRDNVNGNYFTNLKSGYSLPLDSARKITLSSQTLLQLTHGVDYISDIPGQAPMRNTSNTWWGTERLDLKWKLGNHAIGLKGYVGVGHVTSSRKDFDNYTLCDFNYGVTGLVRLPAGFELSTDLTMYSRRGYATSSANTNDLVWNARLLKSFPKSGLTIAVDGFDILNNLSNTTQTINSQGRTEIYYNSLPRYVMAHIIYRFNHQPKKK